MIYFDTAYLVKCYIKEHGWESVRELALRHRRIACSVFGRMELNSSFHRHLREGGITSPQFQIIVTQFELDESRRLWTWFPITDGIMRKVVEVYRELPANYYLRTADALHCVTAADNGVQDFYSSDARLLKGAPYFNLKARNIITPAG